MKKFFKELLSETTTVGFIALVILAFVSENFDDAIFKTGLVLLTFIGTRIYGKCKGLVEQKESKKEKKFYRNKPYKKEFNKKK